jgi:hypothetical protein
MGVERLTSVVKKLLEHHPQDVFSIDNNSKRPLLFVDGACWSKHMMRSVVPVDGYNGTNPRFDIFSGLGVLREITTSFLARFQSIGFEVVVFDDGPISVTFKQARISSNHDREKFQLECLRLCCRGESFSFGKVHKLRLAPSQAPASPLQLVRDVRKQIKDYVIAQLKEECTVNVLVLWKPNYEHDVLANDGETVSLDTDTIYFIKISADEVHVYQKYPGHVCPWIPSVTQADLSGNSMMSPEFRNILNDLHVPLIVCKSESDFEVPLWVANPGVSPSI